MKWHLLVADYNGLSDVDLDSVSIADIELLAPRATIKQYARENVVNWHFDRVNGVMQLSWVQLLERGYKFDEESGEHEKLESYLILALDDNGDYYQQKVVYDEKGEKEKGDPSYLLAASAFNGCRSLLCLMSRLQQTKCREEWEFFTQFAMHHFTATV
jgi:hypothetical protein